MDLNRFRQMDYQRNILQAGDKLLWLGPLDAPWAEYLVSMIGPGGKVICVDREGGKGAFPPNVVYFREDIQRCDLSMFKEHAALFDILTFEILPSGSSDPADMQEAVSEIIGMFLKREGTFLCRAADETTRQRWEKRLKGKFETVFEKDPTDQLLIATNYKRAD